MKKKSKLPLKKRPKTSKQQKRSNEQDKLLVEKAKENPKEYEALYRKYADDVYNYIWYRVGHDKFTSEDLMQDVFVNAFEHLPKFRQRGYSYRTYLLTIARNILANHFRNQPFVVSLEDLADVPDEVTLDQLVSRKLESEGLWRAVQNLSVNERDAVLMFYRSEMPVKDIAAVMGKTPNAVKIILSRARNKLKDHPYLEDMERFAWQDRVCTKPRFLGKNDQ